MSTQRVGIKQVERRCTLCGKNLVPEAGTRQARLAQGMLYCPVCIHLVEAIGYVQKSYVLIDIDGAIWKQLEMF